MTKITMPDPAMFNASGVGGVIYPHGYTATQMEAYATARVREAMEEAAQAASDWSIQYVEVDTAPRQVGEYIRALIKKE